MTAYVVIDTVCIFLAVYRHRNVQVLEQVFFVIFKYPPYMVYCPTPRLTSCFVEPNTVLVHTISAAGAGHTAGAAI